VPARWLAEGVPPDPPLIVAVLEPAALLTVPAVAVMAPSAEPECPAAGVVAGAGLPQATAQPIKMPLTAAETLRTMLSTSSQFTPPQAAHTAGARARGTLQSIT
jgi:hypothetical protein